MNRDPAIQQLVDREAIRDLVLSYSRAIDRRDVELLRDLYTDDAVDTHGDSFDGSADDFCVFIANSMPSIVYCGHHVCNHMIAVEGDVASGEVYALALHVLPADDGSDGEDDYIQAVRYLDNYRRCADGRWRFARRLVTYDMAIKRPCTGGAPRELGASDPSYAVCTQRLFQRGPREWISERVAAE